MGKSRFAIIAAGALMTVAFAGSASAVETAAECTSKGGSVIDVNDGKICFVPIIAEEFQNQDEYAELSGVYDCKGGKVTKTNIGDFCNVYLERKPKPEPVATEDTEAAIDNAILSEVTTDDE